MKHLPLLLGLSLLLFTACVPKIYVIDRQTVLEEEAAGSWPEFEKDFLHTAASFGPTPLAQTPVSERQSRAFNVLNGELSCRAH